MRSLGQLLQRFSSKVPPAPQSRAETLKSVLPMAAVNLGLGMLGGNPVEGLAYGLGDIAVNYPAMRFAQRLSPGKRVTKLDPKTNKLIAKDIYEPSGLEVATNFGASFGSGALVNSLLTRGQQPEATAQQFLAQQAQQINPGLYPQAAQIDQQLLQRSRVNRESLLNQTVSPSTQFQTQGIEQTSSSFHYPGLTIPPELLEQLQAGGMV